MDEAISEAKRSGPSTREVFPYTTAVKLNSGDFDYRIYTNNSLLRRVIVRGKCYDPFKETVGHRVRVRLMNGELSIASGTAWVDEYTLDDVGFSASLYLAPNEIVDRIYVGGESDDIPDKLIGNAEIVIRELVF